jgi:hypothetical protein
MPSVSDTKRPYAQYGYVSGPKAAHHAQKGRQRSEAVQR